MTQEGELAIAQVVKAYDEAMAKAFRAYNNELTSQAKMALMRRKPKTARKIRKESRSESI